MENESNKKEDLLPIKNEEVTVNTILHDIDAIEKRKINLFDKAMKSSDPTVIEKAHGYLQNQTVSITGEGIKSMLVDPLEFASSFGYKEKPANITYGMLARMATTPFTAATIRTRIAQVLKFCVPQEDEYSVGFKMRLKNYKFEKPTKEDMRNMAKLQDFILHCGFNGASWGRDDFETFISKITRDSLTFDQMTFEILDDRRGIPREFIATDAATYRIAIPDKSNEGILKPAKDPLTGEECLPQFVQVYNGNMEEVFYPWELCFGVRNPRTSIRLYGYGYAELEELVNTVTAMLWGDEYNRRFFSQGSAPKGMIRISGNISPEKLKEFKREWQMQMSGVYNTWKTPIMQTDKMDWVDISKTNRDMEYSLWTEYLMKIHSAIFLIDPSEMGFDISKGTNGGSPLSETGNEQRVKYSKDKGLVPLLRSIQRKINRHLISRIDDRYEFIFAGTDAVSEDTALERAIKEVTNFKTVDEIRAKFELRPLGEESGGNLVLNGVWSSWYNNKMLMEQQNQQSEQQDGDFGQEENYSPLDEEDSNEDGFDESEEEVQKGMVETNPFLNDLKHFVDTKLRN